LLTGAECPFTCVYCDLWRGTIDGETSPGAIPAQIRATINNCGDLPGGAAIKLYNHSNFFDARAVPPQDDAGIAELVAPFTCVTVECHPNLIGPRCVEFAARLDGRLEVAMGLETVHPDALAQLNKGMTVADFDRAAGELRRHGIGVRAFVLVSPPFVAPAESVEWAVRSVQHALECGAQHVSLIPVRGGNGIMEELERDGAFVPPTLSQLEDALDHCLSLGGVVTADLWDVERVSQCRVCASTRRARLARINLSGKPEPRVACAECGGR
jgi:radical SAM enzyme (TIGR01210 family)